MRYSITGANKETGEDVSVEVVAVSRHEAEQQAIHQGIMVNEIKLLMEEKNTGAIAMDDEGPADTGDTAKWVDRKPSGTITLGANSPSDTSHVGQAGTLQGLATKSPMEYHIIMNQALYLLETAVNKYLADGWEPAGGLMVGISNNAMQYFQAVSRRRKEGQAETKH